MILPVIRETLVLDLSASDVNERLSKKVMPGRRVQGEADGKIFTGKVSDLQFDITRLLKRPENFMPQVLGTIDETSKGCIIFLKYTLQFSSQMFVVFWSVTTLFFALFLWFIHSNMLLGMVAVGALVLNLLITHVNFRRQLKITRESLMEVLTQG